MNSNAKLPMKKKIVILVERLYEDLEVWYPKIFFEAKGAEVVIAGETKKVYHGKNGYPIKTNETFDRLDPKHFDAVIIPGGFAPDYLRRHKAVLDFVKDMDKAKKTVAAICHGGWVLISAKIIKGRKVSFYYAIRDDILNAGAKDENKVVSIDKNLITSRAPADLPFFCKAIADSIKL